MAEDYREIAHMSKVTGEMPRFNTKSQEADWWANAEGRAFLKRKSRSSFATGAKPAGSALVARLKKASTQIALRLPDDDLQRARHIAERKDIGR